MAINKKSTIVAQSLWNLVKIFISWVLYVVGISTILNQNCGFYINSQVFTQSDFHLLTLYLCTREDSNRYLHTFGGKGELPNFDCFQFSNMRSPPYILPTVSFPFPISAIAKCYFCPAYIFLLSLTEFVHKFCVIC